MSEWLIELLDDSHERAAFSCGKTSLDEFLTKRAGQYARKKIGRTYVAVRQGDPKVCGYYTLSAGAVPFEHFPRKSSKKLPKHPVPVILLGRLAVDQSAQGKGLGAQLLVDALDRALSLSGHLGIYAVEVHAIDESAKSFYEKYGFSALEGLPLDLYLQLDSYGKIKGK